MADKPQCFVIAPIGKEGSDIRMRSDLILKHVIKPVAAECGYKAVRADEISEPGSISTQVLNRILTVPMVVADLTGDNANVFYELAVRHAIRKPYVQIIQKGDRIPFDVAGIRTIEIDHTNLDSVESAKEEMKKQMLYTAENPQNIDSPISVAIDIASLTQSGNPVERQLAEVLKGLAEIKNLVDRDQPTARALGVLGSPGSGKTYSIGAMMRDGVPIVLSDQEAFNLGLREGLASTSHTPETDIGVDLISSRQDALRKATIERAKTLARAKAEKRKE